MYLSLKFKLLFRLLPFILTHTYNKHKLEDMFMDKPAYQAFNGMTCGLFVSNIIFLN